ncbi:MAG: carbonic anhydrase [Fimbriimonadaceae bacterium]
MDNLVRGAAEFNRNCDTGLRSELARLAADGQAPTTLLITCVDSRILPSVITDAPPGTMLSLRNVGNLVPDRDRPWAGGDNSVPATLTFALEGLHIAHIVVMGHSECGGMAELHARGENFGTDALGAWLQNGRRALDRMKSSELATEGLGDVNRLSQLNVLSSLDALTTYAEVRARLDRMQLTLHGWWFDIGNAQVLAHEPRAGRFVPVEQAYESALAQSRQDASTKLNQALNPFAN